MEELLTYCAEKGVVVVWEEEEEDDDSIVSAAFWELAKEMKRKRK